MSQLHNKLGRLLQLERQRLELKLEDLADELKISHEYLEAIENGAIEKLPSDLYFNLFAKSYAERLGIDYARTVEAIDADIEEEPAEQPEGSSENGDKKSESKKTAPSEEEKNNSAFGKKLIQLVIAVVVLFAITLTVYEWFFHTDTVENDAIEETTKSATVAQKPIPEIDYASHEWNLDESTAPPPIKLMVTAREESWASIFVDGQSEVRRTLVPWVEYKLEAKYRFKVSIGIPSRVEVRINGQVVNLVDPATRRITGVEINQLNLEEWMASEPTARTRPKATTTPAEITPSSTRSDHSAQNKTLPAANPDSSDAAVEDQTTTPVDSGGESNGP